MQTSQGLRKPFYDMEVLLTISEVGKLGKEARDWEKVADYGQTRTFSKFSLSSQLCSEEESMDRKTGFKLINLRNPGFPHDSLP